MKTIFNKTISAVFIGTPFAITAATFPNPIFGMLFLMAVAWPLAGIILREWRHIDAH